MNTQSNVMAQPVVTPLETAAVPWHRLMYWLVRRELWEYRAIYLAPLGVAVLILVGFAISTLHLPVQIRAALAVNALQHHMVQGPYTTAAFFLMGAALLVSVFYCLDALYGERRDRSILFWKSMPVSDFTTVLSKASIPILVIPVLTVAVTIATHFVMLLMESLVLLANGVSLTTLWSHLALFRLWAVLLYHLVALHGFWYAPFYGWMLLASAWARRAPLLWAVLPLFAIGVVEKIAFNTSLFAAMLQHRFLGDSGGSASKAADMAMDPLMPLSPVQLVSSPGLWIGLVITAILLAAAVRIRRYRNPL